MIRFAIRLRWAAAQTCLRDKALGLPSSLRAYGVIIALKDSAKSARSLKQSTGRAPAPSAAEDFWVEVFAVLSCQNDVAREAERQLDGGNGNIADPETQNALKRRRIGKAL